MTVTPPTAASMKFVQKDLEIEVLMAFGLVLIALYFALEWMLGDGGELALLPALTFANSRPERPREWLLALAAAGLTVGLLYSGIAVGGWLIDYFSLGTMDDGVNRLMAALPGILAAALVLLATSHSLGRKAVLPGPGDEKTQFDLKLSQSFALLTASFGVAAFLLGLELVYLDSACSLKRTLPLLGLFVVPLCGTTVLLAWPTAGELRKLLLARAGLGVAIVGASYPLGQFIYCLNGDWSSAASFVGGTLALAVYVAATAMAWWQLRQYARRHGMLDFPNNDWQGNRT